MIVDDEKIRKAMEQYLATLPGYMQNNREEGEKLLVGIEDISESCEAISAEILPKLKKIDVQNIDQLEDLLAELISHIEHILWHVNDSSYLSISLIPYKNAPPSDAV